MPIAQLISPQALDLKKDQPGLVILDCRFALEDPDYGQRSYAEGHIAGSSFADIERDLSGKVVKGVTGRHPLPEPAALIERLQAWGINAASEVVLYDDGPGAYAARAWWLLAWLGKREGVFILDGGLKAWHGAGLPLSLDAPSISARSVTTPKAGRCSCARTNFAAGPISTSRRWATLSCGAPMCASAPTG